MDQRDAKIQAKILQLNESLEFKAEEANQKSKFHIGQNMIQIQNNIKEQ